VPCAAAESDRRQLASVPKAPKARSQDGAALRIFMKAAQVFGQQTGIGEKFQKLLELLCPVTRTVRL
jgi:hypothetical protein